MCVCMCDVCVCGCVACVCDVFVSGVCGVCRARVSVCRNETQHWQTQARNQLDVMRTELCKVKFSFLCRY
jgi:hypothetical protein